MLNNCVCFNKHYFCVANKTSVFINNQNFFCFVSVFFKTFECIARTREHRSCIFSCKVHKSEWCRISFWHNILAVTIEIICSFVFRLAPLIIFHDKARIPLDDAYVFDFEIIIWRNFWIVNREACCIFWKRCNGNCALVIFSSNRVINRINKSCIFECKAFFCLNFDFLFGGGFYKCDCICSVVPNLAVARIKAVIACLFDFWNINVWNHKFIWKCFGSCWTENNSSVKAKRIIVNNSIIFCAFIAKQTNVCISKFYSRCRCFVHNCGLIFWKSIKIYHLCWTCNRLSCCWKICRNQICIVHCKVHHITICARSLFFQTNDCNDCIGVGFNMNTITNIVHGAFSGCTCPCIGLFNHIIKNRNNLFLFAWKAVIWNKIKFWKFGFGIVLFKCNIACTCCFININRFWCQCVRNCCNCISNTSSEWFWRKNKFCSHPINFNVFIFNSVWKSKLQKFRWTNIKI